MPIYQLNESLVFPHPSLANEDGILAVGGDLTIERLLLAYQNGIFPWYNEGEPIIWWSPDPRFVLFPEKIRITKSTRQSIRNAGFSVTFDTQFEQVIRNCKHVKRGKQPHGTWITEDMLNAYNNIHRAGFAHSVEVWKENELVGGLYGISIGKCFFGESMFHKASNASKIALIHLTLNLHRHGFWLIDCQQETDHLKRLGAEAISRSEFLQLLEKNTREQSIIGSWEHQFETVE